MSHTLPYAQLTHQAHARGGWDTNTKSPNKSVHEGHERPSHACGTGPALPAVCSRRLPILRDRGGPAGAQPLRVAVEHREEGGAAAAEDEGHQTASVHRGQQLVRLNGDLAASFIGCECVSLPRGEPASRRAAAAKAVSEALDGGVIAH